LQRRVAGEFAGITGSSPDDRWVYLNELSPENMVEFGHVLPVPGQERQWFRTLPGELQDRPRTFETTDRHL
jgi:hypothetical protein